jgi:tRNA pseudouridine55 synthase
VISGILSIDKPVGWTSHDVVARVRRVAAQRQVGHAGTLDPLASGVLLLVLGTATRLSSYLMASPKVYCAEVVLGVTTVTDDAEAPTGEQREIAHLRKEDVAGCVRRFVGELDQVPPRYAAVRQGGRKLYKLAREGVEIEAHPRRVTIDSIEMLAWRPPRLRLAVRCGPGTYIRSLARDIGAALGVGGYLHALRRVASGGFAIESCVSLPGLAAREDVAAAVRPFDVAVAHLPAAVLRGDDLDRFLTGRPASVGSRAEGTIRLYDPTGRMVGLGAADGDAVRPFRVFAGGTPAHANRP